MTSSIMCQDAQNRHCLKVGVEKSAILFIPMDIGGLQVFKTTVESFNMRFKELASYPIEKAAQLYLNYALIIGATDEVLANIGRIITVTKEHYAMVRSRRNKTGKSVTKVDEQATKEVPEPVVVTKERRRQRTRRASEKVVTVAAPSAYVSAAQMFQGLIMEGKLTDDQIFAAVKEAFGLEDKKRSYVTWYRNNLRKKGENPPEAK